MSAKVRFKEDVGVDVFDGVGHEEYFTPKPMAVDKPLARFSSYDSFMPAAVANGEASGWELPTVSRGARNRASNP
jgi:hypothetical protein